MRAYDSYTNNLNTIKKFLVEGAEGNLGGKFLAIDTAAGDVIIDHVLGDKFAEYTNSKSKNLSIIMDKRFFDSNDSNFIPRSERLEHIKRALQDVEWSYRANEVFEQQKVNCSDSTLSNNDFFDANDDDDFNR